MKGITRKSAEAVALAFAVGFGAWGAAGPVAAQNALAAVAKPKLSFPTKVVDSKNHVVGTYLPVNFGSGDGILDSAIVTINGTTHQLYVGSGGFLDNCHPSGGGIAISAFFFSLPNCKGNVVEQVQTLTEGSTPLVLDELTGSSGCVQNNVLYYAQAPYGSNPYASSGDGSDPDHLSDCFNSIGTVWGGALATFDLNTLKLAPPFKLK